MHGWTWDSQALMHVLCNARRMRSRRFIDQAIMITLPTSCNSVVLVQKPRAGAAADDAAYSADMITKLGFYFIASL